MVKVAEDAFMIAGARRTGKEGMGHGGSQNASVRLLLVLSRPFPLSAVLNQKMDDSVDISDRLIVKLVRPPYRE
jgi:hypothetical protein